MNTDDDEIDQFLAQCGTQRLPTSSLTPTDPLPFHYRRKLSATETANAPSFNLGGSALQGLTAGFRVSRSIGDARHVIREVEGAHGEVTDQDLTYACRKAGLTPLKDQSGRWTYADTRKLRG